MKTCPETSGVQISRSHHSRGVPLEVSDLEGRGPRQHAMPEPLGQGEGQASVSGPAHVRGCFCEVAAIHALSGRVNTHVVEPFDELKVAVKRGEIDWLHIVPEFCWCDHDRVITRVVKLCRVARRRGMWWSLENPIASRLWICGQINSLSVMDEVHHVFTPPSQVLSSSTEQRTLLLQSSPSRWTVRAMLVCRSHREQFERRKTSVPSVDSDAARAVARLPGWSVVGTKVASIVEELVDQNQEVLDEVLDSLGDKTKSCVVPGTLCAQLRQRLGALLALNDEQLQPGPGGLFPGVIQGLTEAAQDPDVHIHEWLSGQVPLGISAKIPPGGVFPLVSPQSVGRENDRIRYLHAKVWGTENYASYTEHRAQADEVLQNEIAKGYVQWTANRQEIENDVGTVDLAKIAVVVKGEKVRLIHDMRRNGTNSKVTFEERIVLPRVKDIIEGVMELLERKNNNEGVEFLTLDFRDAFKQLHVVASERRFLAGAAMGGLFSYRTVLFGVGSGPLVWCRVAAWVMRSTQAWLTHDRAHTNCFVDDPIIPSKGTSSQRRKLAMGVLLWWSSLGLKLAYEKGSFGSKAVWIGTQFEVNSRVNKIDVRVSNLMDSPGGMARHPDVRRLAGKAPIETVRKAIVCEYVQEFFWRQG